MEGLNASTYINCTIGAEGELPVSRLGGHNGITSELPVINVVITAANKLARIAWAVLSSGQEYRPAVSPMAA
jgi:hypothetical protein